MSTEIYVDDLIRWSKHPVTLLFLSEVADKIEYHRELMHSAVEEQNATSAYANKAVMDTLVTILTYHKWKQEEIDEGKDETSTTHR